MLRSIERPLRVVSVALLLGAGVQAGMAWAAPQHGPGGGARMGEGRMGEPGIEAQRGPMGYQRLERPSGIDVRPKQFDRSAFNHNFQASHRFGVGPYHAPTAGWKYKRMHFGQILPAAFWGQSYWLTDYWLFGLDMPPVGYEWVRYGPDALLINTTTGEVVQSVYDAFY